MSEGLKQKNRLGGSVPVALQGVAVMSGRMANENLDDVRRMIRQAVEAGRPYLDEERCTGLMKAADRGDLSTVHDLLVEGMIELRGVGFTRQLLQEVDARYETGGASGFLH
jgi:hypothetical protein